MRTRRHRDASATRDRRSECGSRCACQPSNAPSSSQSSIILDQVWHWVLPSAARTNTKGPSPTGRWSSRCHPCFTRLRLEEHSRRGGVLSKTRPLRAPSEGAREAMPWAWITAPGPSASTGPSWRVAVRTETPGSIRSLLAGAGFSATPALCSPASRRTSPVRRHICNHAADTAMAE